MKWQLKFEWNNTFCHKSNLALCVQANLVYIKWKWIDCGHSTQLGWIVMVKMAVCFYAHVFLKFKISIL